MGRHFWHRACNVKARSVATDGWLLLPVTLGPQGTPFISEMPSQSWDGVSVHSRRGAWYLCFFPPPSGRSPPLLMSFVEGLCLGDLTTVYMWQPGDLVPVSTKGKHGFLLLSPVCCSGIPSIPTKIVAEATRPLRVHIVTARSTRTPVFLAHCLLKSLPFPKGVELCGVHPGWARDLVPGCSEGGAQVQVFGGAGDELRHWDARRGLKRSGSV